MGIALAEASNLGATVTLICGPSNVDCSDSVTRIDVMTAQEMFDKAMSRQVNKIF